MSERDFASENDRDIATVREEKRAHQEAILQDAVDIAKKFNLPIELILPMLQKKFPNPGTAGSAENPDPAAAPSGPAAMAAEEELDEKLVELSVDRKDGSSGKVKTSAANAAKLLEKRLSSVVNGWKNTLQ